MHFQPAAGAVVTVVIAAALLFLWYDSRSVSRRLRLPGPGHGSSWDPTTDSRNDWRTSSGNKVLRRAQVTTARRSMAGPSPENSCAEATFGGRPAAVSWAPLVRPRAGWLTRLRNRPTKAQQ